MKKFFSLIVALVFSFAMVVMPSTVKAEDAVISGFVDVSYTDGDETMDDSVGGGTVSEFGAFAVDQVEIDIEKKISDQASVRVDMQFGGGSENIEGTGTTLVFGLEQAYITLKPVDVVELTAGLFNAPVGFEGVDPTDLYQYSHGLVYNMNPASYAGLMASVSPNDMINLKIYVANGLDVVVENNHSKALGGRLGVSNDMIDAGFSYVASDDDDAPGTDREVTIMDFDAKITPNDQITLGLEYNMSTYDEASVATVGDDADATGMLVMANFKPVENAGITVRYEIFDDEDGAILGVVDADNNGLEITSLTFAASYAVAEGADIILEYRTDSADEDIYGAGTELDDTHTTYALEFLYSF